MANQSSKSPGSSDTINFAVLSYSQVRPASYSPLCSPFVPSGEIAVKGPPPDVHICGQRQGPSTALPPTTPERPNSDLSGGADHYRSDLELVYSDLGLFCLLLLRVIKRWRQPTTDKDAVPWQGS
ncbi:hypothetical protein M440DRAFT_1461422 [Trichoderma longibrachiatum ATCC 18648]|uniref:Uncharacterized protein n=1 Tax=Trichoderma longibrachiatum ATCC 18648 TaxID=983965 RepID=A0A2T4C9K9_TRILO|nr:hypothetical protein M440DRAFT_1461422 [Trichoderma longibrachiatum ATCC 18648]